MPTQSVSFSETNYSWLKAILARNTKDKVTFSGIVDDLISEARESKQIDSRNPEVIRKKANELLEQSRALGMRAVEIEEEQYANQKRAQEEADRVLNARISFSERVKGMSPEEVTEEASQWVLTLPFEKKTEFQSFLKRHNLKIREAYAEAMRIGFPEKSLE